VKYHVRSGLIQQSHYKGAVGDPGASGGQFRDCPPFAIQIYSCAMETASAKVRTSSATHLEQPGRPMLESAS